METISKEKMKKQIEEALKTARTMRDEIRLELHLGQMDARDKWQELEPRLADAERFSQEVSDAARTAAASVAKSFREFRDSLRAHSQTNSHHLH
jgi:transposase